MAAARKRLRWVALVFIVAGVAFAILYPESAARAAALPLLAVFSLARMVAAYLLALVFAIAYGTTMALSKRAAVVMLPQIGRASCRQRGQACRTATAGQMRT